MCSHDLDVSQSDEKLLTSTLSYILYNQVMKLLRISEMVWQSYTSNEQVLVSNKSLVELAQIAHLNSDELT